MRKTCAESGTERLRLPVKLTVQGRKRSGSAITIGNPPRRSTSGSSIARVECFALNLEPGRAMLPLWAESDQPREHNSVRCQNAVPLRLSAVTADAVLVCACPCIKLRSCRDAPGWVCDESCMIDGVISAISDARVT